MNMSIVYLIVLSAIIYSVKSTEYHITTSTLNWQSILSNLNPGDIATIHQGTYTTAGSGYFQLTLNGLLTEPIIIQGAPNEPRPIIENPRVGLDAQNILNIQGSNFMLKHLAFTKGSRGVRIGPSATFNAIFDDLYIYDTTSTSFTANDAGNEYYNITLRNTEIKNENPLATAGGCVYFGCVNDLCRVRDSLIEHNYCHDLPSSQDGFRPAFQLKPGSYNVMIRNNACYKVAGPCILVYDDYNRGRNFIVGNYGILTGLDDFGIQCTSGATITNNIIIASSLAGIGVIQNSLYPAVGYIRNLTINHNTVYMSKSDACFRLNGLTHQNILIANNVFYCGNQKSITAIANLAGYRIYNNAVNGPIEASGIQPIGIINVPNNPFNVFSDPLKMNLYPAVGSSLINAGIYADNQLINYDFNGYNRSKITPSIGAYEYSTEVNFGCQLSNSFKCGSSTAATPNYHV